MGCFPICKFKILDHYLDDFLFCGQAGTVDCLNLMKAFEHVCTDIGVPINRDKTEGPTTQICYLGLDIDSEKGLISVPHEKIELAKERLIDLISRKKVSLKTMQSTVGRLNFIAKAIPSGSCL